jgi:hypothetical protein
VPVEAARPLGITDAILAPLLHCAGTRVRPSGGCEFAAVAVVDKGTLGGTVAVTGFVEAEEAAGAALRLKEMALLICPRAITCNDHLYQNWGQGMGNKCCIPYRSCCQLVLVSGF